MNPAIFELQNQINKIDDKIETNKELLKDNELAGLAKDEISKLKQQKQVLLDSLEQIQAGIDASNAAPKTQFTDAILEIRAGAGGDEAKNWANDLLIMYSRWADNNKYKLEALDSGVVKISGKTLGTPYSLLRFESGVHRVQRVPETESSGRIHTSTASVAILPVVKEQNLEVKDEDLDWQFFRSGGKGGQNVNKVSTAVRLIHKPSEIVVTCSSERSQIQNRAIALDLLRAQLWERQEEERLGSLSEQRKAAVGRAMRAEKIRTYNFPQSRVTDHRIKKSWHSLDAILSGDITEILKTVSKEMEKQSEEE